MIKKYVMTKTTNGIISIVDKFEGESAYGDALNKVKDGSQTWECDSFEEIEEMILNHNDVINKVKKVTSEVSVSTGKQDLTHAQKWDWSKTDQKTREELCELYMIENYSSIMVIHNDLKLTNEVYCCSRFIRLIKLNMNLFLSKNGE